MSYKILVFLRGCFNKVAIYVRKTHVFFSLFFCHTVAFHLKYGTHREHTSFQILSLICASGHYALCHLEAYFKQSRSAVIKA